VGDSSTTDRSTTWSNVWTWDVLAGTPRLVERRMADDLADRWADRCTTRTGDRHVAAPVGTIPAPADFGRPPIPDTRIGEPPASALPNPTLESLH
jgi:hypothetical protein